MEGGQGEPKWRQIVFVRDPPQSGVMQWSGETSEDKHIGFLKTGKEKLRGVKGLRKMIGRAYADFFGAA